jgi:hypothetical protein
MIRRHTQIEVAHGAGVSVGMVSLIWSGQRKCSLDIGLRLCVFLGLDPYDLCAWVNSRSMAYQTAKRARAHSS